MHDGAVAPSFGFVLFMLAVLILLPLLAGLYGNIQRKVDNKKAEDEKAKKKNKERVKTQEEARRRAELNFEQEQKLQAEKRKVEYQEEQSKMAIDRFGHDIDPLNRIGFAEELQFWNGLSDNEKLEYKNFIKEFFGRELTIDDYKTKNRRTLMKELQSEFFIWKEQSIEQRLEYKKFIQKRIGRQIDINDAYNGDLSYLREEYSKWDKMSQTEKMKAEEDREWSLLNSEESKKELEKLRVEHKRMNFKFFLEKTKSGTNNFTAVDEKEVRRLFSKKYNAFRREKMKTYFKLHLGYEIEYYEFSYSLEQLKLYKSFLKRESSNLWDI